MLDLVEAGEERYRDEDDNGFLAVADLELWMKEDLVSFVYFQVQELGFVDCSWWAGRAS